MSDNRRDFTDEEFIQAVEKLAPVGTQGVADHVECTRQNARLRLLDLHDQGRVGMAEIGQSYVWKAVER